MVVDGESLGRLAAVLILGGLPMVVVMSCVSLRARRARRGERGADADGAALPAMFVSSSLVDEHIVRLRRLASFLAGTYFTTALISTILTF